MIFVTHPNYLNFKQKAMSTYGLSGEQIDAAMNGAKNLPNIINIMTRPGESKPWYDYRSMFLVEGTIQRGVRFKTNMPMLSIVLNNNLVFLKRLF